MDQKETYFGPFGFAHAKIEFGIIILTKMAVLAILDHIGPAQLPTVLRPLPSLSVSFPRNYLVNRLCFRKMHPSIRGPIPL